MKILKSYVLYVSLIVGLFFWSCNSNTTNPTTATAPHITSLSTTSAVVGQKITIIGNNFGALRGNSFVEFNGVNADTNAYAFWDSTEIQVTIPANATTGNVVVHVSGQLSNGVLLTIIKNYYPMDAGRYWINENYDLNSDNTRNLSTKLMDSTFVSGSLVKFGINASVITTIDSKNTTTLNYFYAQGNALYGTAEYILPNQQTAGFALPITIPDAWVIIADPDSSQWTINTQQIQNQDLSLPGFGTVKLNGSFTVTGVKGTTKVFNPGGIHPNINAQEYKILYEFKGTVTYLIATLPLNFTITLHHWYGENVGLVESLLESTTISIPGIFSQNITGHESTCIDFK